MHSSQSCSRIQRRAVHDDGHASAVLVGRQHAVQHVLQEEELTIADARGAGVEAYAGLVKAVEQGQVDAAERIVVLATGSGLKDIRSAMKSVGEPHRVAPALDAVREALGA